MILILTMGNEMREQSKCGKIAQKNPENNNNRRNVKQFINILIWLISTINSHYISSGARPVYIATLKHSISSSTALTRRDIRSCQQTLSAMFAIQTERKREEKKPLKRKTNIIKTKKNQPEQNKFRITAYVRLCITPNVYITVNF